ncbi:hypothetical protein C8R45DRAFT_933126 [Mycena sanguinolenta]|nr:hypothetical protein C8R45DRAFT_933126 [Mycena sanguinolenta]
MDNLIGKCPNSQPAAVGNSNSNEFLIVDTNASIANSSDAPPIDVDDDDNTADPIKAEGDTGNSDVDSSTEVTAPGSKYKQTAAPWSSYTRTESTMAPVPVYKKSKMDLNSVVKQEQETQCHQLDLAAIEANTELVFQRKMQMLKAQQELELGVDAVRAMFLEEFGVISSAGSNTHTHCQAHHSTVRQVPPTSPSHGLIFSAGGGYNSVLFYGSPQ